VLYAFLRPSELVEDGINGLTGIPRSTLAVTRKTNFCKLTAVMAKVASQLGHGSVALRAVLVLREAEAIASPARPPLSGL